MAVQLNASAAYARLGMYSEAEDAANDALRTAEKARIPSWIADAHQSLGLVFLYQREFTRAQPSLDKALKLAITHDLNTSLPECHAYLGQLHYHAGNAGLCREHTQEALESLQRASDREVKIEASAYAAAQNARDGAFAQSVSHLRNTLKDAEDFSNLKCILICRRLLGEVLLKLCPSDAERSEGRAILEEALALAKEKEIAYEIDWIGRLLDTQ
jgi:tetratricopeptide (TPR) repeat protein